MANKTVIKQRSMRSDSISAAVQAAKNAAAGSLSAPIYVSLPPEAEKFWGVIIENRARDAWNTFDLVNAAELARLYADIERLRGVIAREGDTTKAGKPHAAHKLLENCGRRAIALARVLHVHPEATEGRAREAGNKLHIQREAEKTRADDCDDLIPMLRVVK